MTATPARMEEAVEVDRAGLDRAAGHVVFDPFDAAFLGSGHLTPLAASHGSAAGEGITKRLLVPSRQAGSVPIGYGRRDRSSKGLLGMARAVATPRRRTVAGRRGPSEELGAEPISRRDHIIELAAQLFAEKGVATTTVRDIGEAAGILSGSLYYHFSSKEAIVEEIVHRYLAGLAESYRRVVEVHDEPRARLRGLIGASFQAIEQHRWACEIYQNDHTYLQTMRGLSDLEPLTSAVQSAWTDTPPRGGGRRVPGGHRRQGVLPIRPRRHLVHGPLVRARRRRGHRRARGRLHDHPARRVRPSKRLMYSRRRVAG